ncbi:MAG: hydrogenase formation protein HypD [Spirochaetaceae bacterium]|jgi:hydrogenase expression/formation protein HypD|nr:hydrogenase formation protein HypD [Spirochaetaceae bacterium]
MNVKEKIQYIKNKIQVPESEEYTFMEVCGTHTMSIAANGIRSLLPEGIKLISGPGCPVCVTSQSDIELALILARKDNTIISTFGDMIRVPSGNDRLENYKNVKIVYSPMESLSLAEKNPDKEIVFIGIGFETTAPLTAATIEEAEKKEIKNFSVLSLHKTVPAALELILSDKECHINGLILPGHVSAVTGSRYFDFLKKLQTPGVITGFDALNIMECIYLLSTLNNKKAMEILNNYRAVVTEEGNQTAMRKLDDFFETSDSIWRGLGTIPGSGLKIREKYKKYDAFKKFSLSIVEIPDPPGCLCGKILLGKASPVQCSHFGKGCTPSLPVGPCMVSSEGTCAAWYKYGTS